MFGVGPEELLLIALLGLLVLGPERLPKMMRDVGRVVGDLRRTSDELRSEFLNADRYLEAPAAPVAAVATDTATVESVSDGPPDELPFDREMRQARERLRGI
ncbi:MAG TPA: twin-arginine translocase TatA/TatE family subunit [Candidatus Limnocylindrales bacterium]|nr:twin-arginine translocase TatA/TatE family subunit [Candidatus Limnocylindrales bacterium]